MSRRRRFFGPTTTGQRERMREDEDEEQGSFFERERDDRDRGEGEVRQFSCVFVFFVFGSRDGFLEKLRRDRGQDVFNIFARESVN